MEQLARFFSFSGRVSRATFWINTLVCGVMSFILDLLFVDVRFSVLTMEERYDISNKPVFYIASLLISVRILSIAARRWQDQDKSGWLAVTLFFPVLSSLFPNFIFYTGLGAFVAIVGSIVLLVAIGFMGFVPGDEGNNQYGAPDSGSPFVGDPLPAHSTAFPQRGSEKGGEWGR
jgi:uncharacterized membrane protein YhaH (DUF805 family)